VIGEIGYGIISGQDLKTILNILLEKTIHLIRETSVGGIHLLSEDGKKLKIMATQGEVSSKPDEIKINAVSLRYICNK
jgi:signal transduction protein with GAF and PtsI domain